MVTYDCLWQIARAIMWTFIGNLCLGDMQNNQSWRMEIVGNQNNSSEKCKSIELRPRPNVEARVQDDNTFGRDDKKNCKLPVVQH
jgi:hypothetical protein